MDKPQTSYVSIKTVARKKLLQELIFRLELSGLPCVVRLLTWLHVSDDWNGQLEHWNGSLTLKVNSYNN